MDMKDDAGALDKTAATKRGSTARKGLRTRGGRLPPVLTRDVPTTEAAPAKKVLAPNIPQRRTKAKECKDKESTKDEPVVRGRGANRRGRGRGRREYIQTAGSLFGEGLAATVKKSRYSATSSKDTTVAPPVYKAPKIYTKKELEEENKFDTEDNNEYESSDEDDLTERILRLPLKNLVLDKRTEESKIRMKDEIKQEIKKGDEAAIHIKQEMEEEIDELQGIQQEIKEYESTVKKEEPKCTGILKTEEKFSKELLSFSEEENELLFLQLPTHLPFQKLKLCDERDASAKEPTPVTEQRGETIAHGTTEDDPGTPLRCMKEGFVGKLQILKSGEMRMKLGEQVTRVLFDNICFQEEAVVIEHQADSCDITVLGSMKKWVLCEPVIQGAVTS